MKQAVFSLALALVCASPAPSAALLLRNKAELSATAEAASAKCPVGLSGCTQLGVGFADENLEVVAGNSVYRCRWLCERTQKGNCAGFTFDFEEGQCYLKKSLDKPEQRDSAVSGTKACLVAGLAGCAAFDIGLRDADIVGNQAAQNMQDCRHQCLKQSRCEAYTYNHATKRCFMKATQNSYYAYNSDLTASKHCNFDGSFPCTKLNHKSDAAPIDTKNVNKAADCFYHCREAGRCKFINFDAATKKCHLLSEHGNLVEAEGFLFSPIKCSVV